MKRGFAWMVSVGMAWWSATLHADPGDETLFPAPSAGEVTLSLYGATDTVDIVPVVHDFQKLHPDLAVRYRESTTMAMRGRFLQDRDREDGPDVIISTAMDLQVQLVNEGWAQPYRSAETGALRSWAQWRNELFGYSYEPVILAYNRKLIDAAQVPRTRYALLAALRDPARPLRGRIGTYDVTRSGIGYLVSSQDARLSSVSGALYAAMGDNDVVLMDQSGALLDKVSNGELTMAYNVLGAYAQRRIDAGAPLAIMQLEDYTQVLMRTVFIPRTARRVDAARKFVDYLLSQRGQGFMAAGRPLPPLRMETDDASTPAGAGATQRAIPLGPGLLVYLDRLKRQHFVESWEAAMRHPHPQREAGTER